MARAQQNKKPQNKQTQNTQKVDKVKGKKKVQEPQKRDMTKKELMFYRGGMLAILLTVVVVTVVLIVRTIANNELERNPYEDYISIVESELEELVFDREDGQYGDFTFFNNKEGYEDLAEVINTNDVIYFYFYRSSDMNQEITDALLEIENIDDLAILFIDLDRTANQTVFENPRLAHLPLVEDRNHQLIRFYIDTQTFESDARVDHILIELNKLA
ncbi:MAG: hypothetical protein ACNA7K_05630 [Acholeplasmataceae bacterium]